LMRDKLSGKLLEERGGLGGPSLDMEVTMIG
jgi:hypothetical protein